MAFWARQSKDRTYVVNVVSHYRRELDQALAARGQERNLAARTSSGQSFVDWEPDLSKTFNRGYTPYFLHGRSEPPGAIDSPKMVGETLGPVMAVGDQSFVLDTSLSLNSGDGLCWFDEAHELCGTVVNAAQPTPGGLIVTPQELAGIRPGLQIYRNHDRAFLHQVERSRPVRKIAVRLRMENTAEGFVLHAEDEDGNQATSVLEVENVPAHKPDQAEDTTRRQLSRTGETPFACIGVQLAWDRPYFLPVATLNALRRETLDRLLAARSANRPVTQGQIRRNDVPYPETRLTYRGNALNQQAVAFYRRHGVREIDPAAEAGLDMAGLVVMRSRYCLKHQLGLCDGTRQATGLREPLYLVDQSGHHYRLRFDCAACEMEVLY